jgi:hypothetical protein
MVMQRWRINCHASKSLPWRCILDAEIKIHMLQTSELGWSEWSSSICGCICSPNRKMGKSHIYPGYVQIWCYCCYQELKSGHLVHTQLFNWLSYLSSIVTEKGGNLYLLIYAIRLHSFVMHDVWSDLFSHYRWKLGCDKIHLILSSK